MSKWLSSELIEYIQERKMPKESVNAYLERILLEEEEAPKAWTEDEIKDLAEEKIIEMQRRR